MAEAASLGAVFAVDMFGFALIAPVIGLVSLVH